MPTLSWLATRTRGAAWPWPLRPLTFTPRSAKNAKVRIAGNVLTAKEWNVEFQAGPKDVSNFEGGGYSNTDLDTYFHGLGLQTAPVVSAVSVDGAANTPGSDEFVRAYHHVYPGQAPLEFNTNGYDAMNISALAMLEAKSTTPSVWIDKIASITGNTSLTRVSTFAQGKQAIAAGKSVYYYGATGQILFNKYHNASGNFEASAFNADGSFRQLGTLPAPMLQKYVR